MKKVTLFIMVCLLGTVCFGRRHHHGGHRFHGGHHHHVRHFYHGHHHHGGSWWGRGGRNFWPGFVGGVVAGSVLHSVYSPRTTVVTTPTVVSTPVVATPTVIQQPVVVTQPQPVYQQVWVEGRYVDQVQPNGTTIRVWQPGHYQQIQVR